MININNVDNKIFQTMQVDNRKINPRNKVNKISPRLLNRYQMFAVDMTNNSSKVINQRKVKKAKNDS